MNGIKIIIEIGHESSLKARPTPEGFTHDWQLFVRGCDQNEISHYVDKVVFNLHESFAKPKRAIKEPPYLLKESGYAGFEVNIDIYVKNRDEPKKISFVYDMDLQNSGPSICRTQSFTHTFINPSDEFARKLRKGGGVAVYNTSMVNNFDEKSRDRPLTMAPTTASSNGDAGAKGSSAPVVVSSGKHKSREQPTSEFSNLFGTPITKTNSSSSSSLKVSPDPKAHRKTSPNRAAVSGSTKGSSSSASTSGSGKGDKSGTTSSSTSSKDKSSSSSSSSRSRHTSDSPHVDRGDKYERRDGGDKGKRERNRSRERSDKGGGSSSNTSSSKDKSQKRRPSSPKYSSPSVAPATTSTANPTVPPSKSRSPSRNSTATDYQTTSAKGASQNSTGSKSGEGATTSSSSSSKKSSKKDKKEKSHDKERSASSSGTGGDAKKERDSGKRDTGTKFSASTGKDSSHAASSGHSGRNGGDEKDKEKKAKETAPAADKEKRSSGHDRDSSTGASGSSPLDPAKKHKHKKKDKDKGSGTSSSSSAKDQGKGAATTTSSKDQDSTRVQSPITATNASHGNSQFPRGAVTPPTNNSSGLSSKEKKQRTSKEGFANSPAVGVGTAKSLVSSSEKSQDAFSYNHKASHHSNLSDSDDNEQLAEPLHGEEAAGGFGKSTITSSGGSGRPKKEKGERKNKRKLKEDLSDGQANSSPSKMEPPLKLPRKQAPSAEEEGHANKNGTGAFENNNSYHGSNNHQRLAEPEYIQELKALQYKIMNLQDSNDLQQVVEIIAVTGMYEITDATKTFDFDLCDLPPETLKNLTTLLNRFST